MNKIYLLECFNVPEHKNSEYIHPFYEELSECLDKEDQKNIGFTDSDNLFVRLPIEKINKIEKVFKKYFIFCKKDVSDKVISGEIQKLYPEVEKFTPRLFTDFRLDYTKLNDVLDKINNKGIESIDDIDRLILNK